MHFIVFSLSILIALFFISGYSDAAKPPNSLKSKAKQNQSREPRIKLYERTLRKHLASGSYPLIDLEVSLDQWKSAAQLIEGMDRAGVALGAVTSTSEEAIKKAVAQYPGRLIPLTTSAAQKDWMRPESPYLSNIKRQLEGGAFGIGRITWRPGSAGKAESARVREALGAIIRLATEKRSFLLLDMPPDDGGLEQLERQLRAAPEARVVWTQAGRILNLNALPGYGHGLLQGAEPEAPPPFLHTDSGPACPRRFARSKEKPPLRPRGGVLP